ncbi:ATP-binding protein [Olsenella sp. Marseille-P4559]|uniref:ATP-binding protein n=1 Tax=Olsenella sp. Marseille-P4559 TaxID=2364795 RepID=UPI001030F4D3|nr:ATP-binding protein [Olsenella sp. Marseille-P4559]
MPMVYRSAYMERLRSLEGTRDIKVITGVRRSGKSELMKAFASETSANDSLSNNVYLDLLDLDNEGLLEYHALHKRVVEMYREGAHNRLFVDEVQLCDGFERAINSIYSRGGWDIYLTGSNAFLLGSGLASLFTGRQKEIHIFPFSFCEYREYFGGGSEIDDDFNDFVKRGGLAGSYAYGSLSESYGYIRDIYRTILTRDLVQKFSLSDTTVLERLAEYMMSNAGNLNSPNNIANTLEANRVSTNHVTVGRYMSYLRDTFVFYEARRFDIKGKKYLSTQAKHYVCDTGMRYAILGTRNMVWGRMYENVVFLELLRRGYEVYVGKLYQKEVDFVAKKESELVYIQVSDDISPQLTLKRELAPLLAVRDAYPKVLIARTRHEEYSIEGVRIIDIARWLLGEGPLS